MAQGGLVVDGYSYQPPPSYEEACGSSAAAGTEWPPKPAEDGESTVVAGFRQTPSQNCVDPRNCREWRPKSRYKISMALGVVVAISIVMFAAIGFYAIMYAYKTQAEHARRQFEDSVSFGNNLHVINLRPQENSMYLDNSRTEDNFPHDGFASFNLQFPSINQKELEGIQEKLKQMNEQSLKSEEAKSVEESDENPTFRKFHELQITKELQKRLKELNIDFAPLTSRTRMKSPEKSSVSKSSEEIERIIENLKQKSDIPISDKN